ncbi:hypothetical protein [Streptomyces sp. NPDC050560]|uniref:hypothetical protein n=1 Tax=Streptomyces sp. NPDC050560 TaxID=3365630 RepID=UPI0037BB14FD
MVAIAGTIRGSMIREKIRQWPQPSILAALLDRWQRETGDPILSGPIPGPVRE